MKKDKYKILVLSDLKKSTSNILKNSIGLASKINAEITFFHVKKPTDVIKQDNQLSAVRAINSDYTETDKEIKKLINSMTMAYGVNIKYTFVIGNVKDEIGKVIDKTLPDIIVLGRRTSKTFKLIGNNITKYVLTNYKGGILIASNNNILEPKEEFSMATLNRPKDYPSIECVRDLMQDIQKPLKSFRIINKSNELDNLDLKTDEKALEYVFDYKDGAIKNLSKYIRLSKINLLCLDRGNKGSKDKNNFVMANINEIIGSLDVSLLLT